MEDAKSCPIDGLDVSTGTTPTHRALGRIEFKHVSFAYPSRPEVRVCRGWNMVIEAGEVVALVGCSGGGKVSVYRQLPCRYVLTSMSIQSTIINLLMRFYDPQSGSVTLDGADIKALNVRWLRSQIGYVGQEPVLFSGTIADNIAKGRVDYGENAMRLLEASRAGDSKGSPLDLGEEHDGSTTTGSGEVDADIRQAAEDSNAHEFITKFVQGYNTDIGSGGSSMVSIRIPPLLCTLHSIHAMPLQVSGGQKQRIAIARALVKKPAVLLLDEATSALDAASERMVQETISTLQAGHKQTTIIIAHRLSTIRGADKIVVIDRGRVVEVGKHDELLAMNGIYNQLWCKQNNRL